MHIGVASYIRENSFSNQYPNAAARFCTRYNVIYSTSHEIRTSTSVHFENLYLNMYYEKFKQSE